MSIHPWQETYQALTDSALFDKSKSKSGQSYLRVKQTGTGEKILEVAHLSFLERVQAWLGFGNASLRNVHKFLSSEEGKTQLNTIFNSGNRVDKQRVIHNLNTLKAKSAHALSPLNRIKSASQFILPTDVEDTSSINLRPQEAEPGLPKKTVRFDLPSSEEEPNDQSLKDHHSGSPQINDIPEPPRKILKSNAGRPLPLEPKLGSVSLKIQTNLAEQRPHWVPQTVVSKNGTLSTQNFNSSCMPDALSSADKEARLKWFFSQRKYPPVSRIDTVNFSGIKDPLTYPTQDDYAASASAHGPHQLIFLSDEKISHIAECQSIRFTSKENIPIGVYADGKTMIQQQATRGCVAACAAMLVEDQGRNCDVRSLQETNLADEIRLLAWINKSGLKGGIATINGSPAKLRSLIQKHGSISIGISDRDIGSHQIILDDIDAKKATIRDPFHGWRITIPTSELIKMAGKKIEAVYIEKTQDT
ncbi:hypothetical protein [Candidatus Protochlamydia phocaeensis]|uniref:hypothetical protein n=1 Tax=Candidatus Protochlamydia phocaeensis TaxID=1414722 RepID=UPI00083980FC|nr:hypothetical protein [Candidatus Protochlamydia phocaeensis]